jgi:CheY-like chemotaxis protein
VRRKPGEKLVLVVEDSPTQSIHVQSLLEGAGLACALATNGQTGLYLAESLMPDVIVLDLEMPYIDGFQVCRQLKADPTTAGIPVIMMTRHDGKLSMDQGLELGAVDFIPKDVFADAVLLETLKQMKIITR